jgi:molybdopterin-guanine dinucleotide biosynthesis protein A
MRCAGFVLVGGKSSRMGRDKALLRWHDTTLAQHVAAVVAQAAGSATLVGDPERYGALGYSVIGDRLPGSGPLGGIITALSASNADWALVVACDMPRVTPDLLRLLLKTAASAIPGCVFPVGPTGPEPLCAVYHRECLPALEKAAAEGRFKMREAVRALPAVPVAGIDPHCLTNLNTAHEFEAFSDS